MTKVSHPDRWFTIRLPEKFGRLLVRYRNGRLVQVQLLGRGSKSEPSETAKQGVGGRDEELEARLRADFVAYFSGEKVPFNYAVDTKGFTAFQRAVWGAMRKIRYGETRSYGWIAETIGRPLACRAVGNACGRNPLLIVQPCHRVVASNGGLGGFSAGLDLKRALLKLEGVVL